MYILFEEHPYEHTLVKSILNGIYNLQDVDKKVNVPFVGYFYNSQVRDCVFILPKVLLTEQEIDVDGKQVKIDIIANVSSKTGNSFVRPEDIITQEDQKKHLDGAYRKFIYEFSVWIYRALKVFLTANPKSQAIFYEQLPQAGKGRRHHVETYLDIVLSLIKFNQENRDFILFTVKNLHRGNNKINWTRTLSHSQAFVQGDEVVYLNPVNKKRVVNYEEELFIIFFSILHYLNEEYGFHAPINIQYELIKGKQFKQYLNGLGKTRLRQIKYKYFSDKALQLWDLCYAFFDSTHRIAINTNAQEYILANSFNIVFEAMIDEQIGDKDLPADLKSQRDDKRIDHLYTYKYLIENIDDNNELMTRDVYNIADSKYYKRDKELRGHDVPKQFTYARNVIQWHMDLLHDLLVSDKEKAEKYKGVKLFDEVTEGYNIIPNFFISGFVEDNRNYDIADLRPSDLGNDEYARESYIFWERLFDRSTLFTLHYDVNFLYITKLYAQNKSNVKAMWKVEVRKRFRNEMLAFLNNNFNFYQVIILTDEIESFVEKHFRKIIGKVFSFTDVDGNRVLLYAERKDQDKGNGKSFEYDDKTCTHVGDGHTTLYIPAGKVFYLYRLSKVDKLGESKYQNADEGCCKDEKHIDSIKKNGIYDLPEESPLPLAAEPTAEYKAYDIKKKV